MAINFVTQAQRDSLVELYVGYFNRAPEAAGLIVADAFGAAVIRDAPAEKLSPARRKAVTLRLARLAAMRLSAAADAGWTASEAALTSSGL